jgi:DNA mismatch repair protein MutL
MKKIYKLSPLQIAKIAAGEVIEKPAFAVKELVENSLDAQASHVQIFLEDSGLQRIQIIDDGEGMNKDDLSESFKLHTTSKISNNDELIAINTLGFRGEALASLASISRLKIQSRTVEMSSGNIIQIENGKQISFLPIGMPKGTQVEVRDLFYSIPARKKFIENSQKEYRLTLEILIKIALANPGVRFSLHHNKKLIFDTPKNQTLHQRLLHLLKDPNLEKLIPIRFEDSYLKIDGFTSSVQDSTSSSSKQFIFINKRPVSDKLIMTAVREVYGNFIDSNKFPIFVLNIKIPNELIDVNVHPRKDQIQFYNPQLVFDQVQKALYQSLQIGELPSSDNKSISITKSLAGHILKNQDELFLLEKKIKTDLNILQTFDLFLVFQAQNDLFIVDQHAAHERILYEQFKQLFQEKKQKKYKLPKKMKLDLSVQEREIVSQNITTLKKFGITVQTKRSEFHITEVPEILKDRNFLEIFSELIEQINQDKKMSFDLQTDKMLKYLACRGAIKQGDKLNTTESRELITKLFETPNSLSCPHGRPTFIKTSLTELFKQFKRY